MNRLPVRYLPWMARDVFAAQGAVLLAIGTLIYVIMSRIDPAPKPSEGPEAVRAFVQQLWPFLLFCAASIVSKDRSQGYYRGYFSRPISPPGFYLMRWLLGALVAALLVPVLTASLALAIGSFPLDWTLVARVALFYLLLGGVTFLASTVMRTDWLLGLLIFMLQSMLSQFKRNGMDLPNYLDFLLEVLPPFHLTTPNAPPAEAAQLAHVLLYGAGLVLAALAVLRWRPLGAGGRS